MTDVNCEIAVRWMKLHLTDDKSTLVQVMAWCRQATGHYLSQCWPKSAHAYGVTRSQWVNWSKQRNWRPWSVIQCGAVETRSTFSNMLTQNMHCSPDRVIYGCILWAHTLNLMCCMQYDVILDRAMTTSDCIVSVYVNVECVLNDFLIMFVGWIVSKQ